MAPLGQLWHASRPCKLFLLGFETAMWHVLGTFKSLKSSKLSAAAVEGSSIRHHGTPLGPTNSFYWASKLLRGTSKLLCGTQLSKHLFLLASKLLRGTSTLLRGLKSFNTALDSSPIRHQGTSLGLAKCFKTATWHVLAPFKSLKSSKPSAEACVASAVAPPVPAFASKYAASRPCKLFLLGF